MLKIKLSLFALLLVSTVQAQISQRLLNAMEEYPNAMHQIRVEFTENVDCYALNHEFKQTRLDVNERPKVVISQLQQQAELSQTPVKQMLEGPLRNKVQNVHSFWVVNMIILQAKATVIEQLAEIETVALIDLEDSDIIPHDPIIKGEASNERSPNGVEPGLVAINAPAMWALGYTGRGRLVYDYDTGVWPTHPAFADRFLAHRFPLEQCWTGFFSDIPNGNVSDHGTHTLGTMAGLVEETNDTIGVAFGAYWIASDFVTSTVEALPPLASMMGAFEWALNPDGDINTTDDIPDVINNSWRWRDDPDTVQCAGAVVNLMNAIEAAGIANVFSGGNSGPNNTTVNAPQRINTSEVNTFSVGSVNGNASFPYPISNFSTIGPTQCPHNGSTALEIHPEVVAPGQNVRSAWGTDGFNTISGTSMAAPHVSGAVLLLKEAFPYLSGEDLLWALYETAVDLGDVGEDNVYGRGIIDVFAAYQHLAQSNVPIDPNFVHWDIEIEIPTAPFDNGITCDNSIHPTVFVTNKGDSTITEIDFEYSINNGAMQAHNWAGTLLPGNTVPIVVSSISTTDYGNLELNMVASIPDQPNEYDNYNNHWRYSTNRREPTQLPFIETFEQGFAQNDWLIQNPDASDTWDTTATGGLQWSNYSAAMPLFNYSPRANQRDGLISPLFNIPNTTEPVWLLFDVAYQLKSESLVARDTLQVLTSTDCGQTFDAIIYDRSGEDLETIDTSKIDFVPAFEWDWRRDSVSLSQYAGEEVMLKFQTINRQGNNVYIDNVKVFVGDMEPEGITDFSSLVSLYPNPTTGSMYVEVEGLKSTITDVGVLSLLGQQVAVTVMNQGNRLLLTTEKLETGIYLLDMQIEDHRVVKRFVKR